MRRLVSAQCVNTPPAEPVSLIASWRSGVSDDACHASSPQPLAANCQAVPTPTEVARLVCTHDTLLDGQSIEVERVSTALRKAPADIACALARKALACARRLGQSRHPWSF